MKFILSIILFFTIYPSSVLAGCNDVYFCEMKQWVYTTKDGSSNREVENFTFKRYRDKLIFGEHSYYTGLPKEEGPYEMELVVDDELCEAEVFESADGDVYYYDNTFMDAGTHPSGQAMVIIAVCDVFD